MVRKANVYEKRDCGRHVEAKVEVDVKGHAHGYFMETCKLHVQGKNKREITNENQTEIKKEILWGDVAKRSN